MKSLINSLILNFKCSNCGGKTKEENVEMVGIAGTNLNLDISCESCEKHTFIKTQLTQIDLSSVLKTKKEGHKLSTLEKKEIEIINEKEILQLRKVLKEKDKVEDLFN